MKIWNKQEIELLIDLFPNMASKELVTIFNRSYASIVVKAKKMGLKKTKAHRANIAGITNKIVKRDLSFNNVCSIALEFKTRKDFKIKDASAYKAAVSHGWLDSVCAHMLPQNYSTPQLILNIIIKSIIGETKYNDRKIIKPLELDVYVPKFNIAFEYDGKFWHKSKNKKKIESCAKKGIKLFILTETNRNYETDVKMQLISMIEEINKHCQISVTKEQIQNIVINYEDVIMNYNDLKKICLENTNYKKFKEEFPSIWLKLKRSKLLKDYTSHMKRWSR